MADFKAWSNLALVKFAEHAQIKMDQDSVKMAENAETIKELREQLRTALNEYRRLIILKG